MNYSSQRVPAFIAYLPVIGWIYVLAAERKSQYAMFHLRQSIGIVLFMIASFVAWLVTAWILAWIHFGTIFSVSLFMLVITAFIYGFIAWIMGMSNALRGRIALLPIFGSLANRLPF